MHDSEYAKESIPFLQSFYEAGNSLPLFEFDGLSDAEWLRGIAALERTYRPETTVYKLPPLRQDWMKEERPNGGMYRVRMTEAVVREMRKDREAGMSYTAISKKHDCSLSNARLICQHRTWKHIQ